MAVSESRKQIFVFGGASYTENSCSNAVYCFDYEPTAVDSHLSQVRAVCEEASALSRDFVKSKRNV